ncbi:GNAT family N-acetyltransferase [Candidatus Pacearchaeota archaeon]|nr:GNAT family N-acetyltransferase [Candidatus Pacearchaeota archaeon]
MKIKLKLPKISDTKEFREIFNDKEVGKQLSGYKYPLHFSEAKKKLQEIITQNKKGDYYEFAIIYNNKFVGLVCLGKPSKDKKIFTLGYAVGRKYWNKGIATKSVKKIVNFGFSKLKLNKIVADNDEDNLASAKVLEKNGFKFVKRVEKKRRKTDKKVRVLFWEKKNLKGGTST